MEQEAKMPVKRRKRDINERTMHIICKDSLFIICQRCLRELLSKLYDRKDKLYSKFACHNNTINAYTQCGREVLHKISIRTQNKVIL